MVREIIDVIKVHLDSLRGVLDDADHDELSGSHGAIAGLSDRDLQNKGPSIAMLGVQYSDYLIDGPYRGSDVARTLREVSAGFHNIRVRARGY